jgi:hypothetical protein
MIDYAEPIIQLRQALKLLDEYLLQRDYLSAEACLRVAQENLTDAFYAVRYARLETGGLDSHRFIS